MKKSMPLQWIEEREARQALATASGEPPAAPSRVMNKVSTPWLELIRDCVRAVALYGTPEPSAVPVRAKVRRR